MKISVDQFSDQFLDLFQVFPGVVYRLNSTNQKLVPEWVGRNFAAVTGYPSKDIIGTTYWWTELIHPEDRGQALEALGAVSATGAASCQYRLKHGDGAYRRIRDEIRKDDAATADAMAPRFIGTWSDITNDGFDLAKLKQSQVALREAKEQAEKASAAKSEFLSVMSHELRTPLNAIIGFSDVILMKAFGPIGSDRYTSYIEDIRASGKRLLDLVNDLLDVSTLESGRLRLHMTAVNIDKICKRCINHVSLKAENGKVELSCQITPDMPSLKSDEQRLKQILINLLSNAIKFSPEQERVILRAGIGPSGGIRFEISDNGIGMNEQDLEVALSNFGQVDGSLSRRHEGSGLGLPLAKSFVEALNGVLDVQSQPGEGTTVVVQFPKHQSGPY